MRGGDPGSLPALGRRALAGLDLLLPPSCVACGAGLDRDEPPVCTLCRLRLPRVDPPLCARCGATRTGSFAPPGRCPECEGWPEGLRAAAPWRLEGVALRVVHALKYEGWTRLAPWMAGTMLGAARRLAAGTGALLVPVPLSSARRRERGFNQAELLARALGALAGWPWRPLLARRRAARQQARLGRSGRAANVRDLFVARPPAREGLRHGPVLLVDDVLTTGATAAACAEAISAAGFEFRGVIHFARVLRRWEAERQAKGRWRGEVRHGSEGGDQRFRADREEHPPRRPA